MKRLSNAQLREITGGGASGATYCGIAMGVATLGGPLAWFGAAIFCIAVTPGTAQ